LLDTDHAEALYHAGAHLALQDMQIKTFWYRQVRLQCVEVLASLQPFIKREHGEEGGAESNDNHQEEEVLVLEDERASRSSADDERGYDKAGDQSWCGSYEDDISEHSAD